MELLSGKYLQRWLIPAASAAVFLLLLAWFIPYTSSIGSVKLSLAGLILLMSNFGTNHPSNAGLDYTYCLFVPFIFAFLVYLKWGELERAPLKGSNAAAGLIVFGVFVYWFGMLSEVQYFGYAAIQILLAGLILWLWGAAVFRLLLFPWAFFLFAWPLPFLDPIIAFPLRMVMSRLAGHLLPLIGIPCVQSGTAILSLPDPLTGSRLGDAFQIDIADPCSGIRSLFALLMFSALFGYLYLPRFWQQWTIFLSAFPLAIVGNLFRVLILVVGSIWFGTAFAIGTTEQPSWFHEACGFAIYAVALGLEFLLANLLMRNWHGSAKVPASQ